MRHALTHGGQKLALILAVVATVALPMPAQAGPATATSPRPAPTAAPAPASPTPAVAEASSDSSALDAAIAAAPSEVEAFSEAMLTAPTAVLAQDLAVRAGKPVEVLDARTTYRSLFAMPDGSWHQAQSTSAQWASTGGDGLHPSDWAPVETVLQANGDGTYSPSAHPFEVVVNGGSGEFFRLTDPATGVQVALSLRSGTVPAPAIDGPRATFAGIAPGIDLMVEIRPSGYEYFLVLKTPAAAARSGEVPLDLRVVGGELVANPDGGWLLLDASGEQVGAMPQAIAWDAHSDLKHGSPVLDDWSPEMKYAPVTRALDGLDPASRVAAAREFLSTGEDLQTDDSVAVVEEVTASGVEDGTYNVALALPAAWTEASSTTYPIVLDPVNYYGPTFDTFVQVGYTSDWSGDTDLKLGSWTGASTDLARTYMKFKPLDLQYASVTHADLYLYEYHSSSCGQATWQVKMANTANTSTRWTNQPAVGGVYGETNWTRGFSASCDDGWVAVTITGLPQFWSAYAAGTVHGMAVVAKYESNSSSWKRFYSSETTAGPYVVIDFTTVPPLAPTNITVDGVPLTAAHRTDFTSKRPVFRATVTDNATPPVAGGRPLYAAFLLYKDGVYVDTYKGNTVASGGTSTYTPTADLEEGAAYTVMVTSAFNDSTFSTAVEGGGKFTTISAQPSLASDIMLNSDAVPGGVVQGDGSVVVVGGEPGATLAPRVLDDATPAFSAVVSDPDGGQVRAVFSLYRKRTGETGWELLRNDLYGSWVTSGQRSYFGSTASSNDPGLEAALVAGNEYRIEVRSQDKSQASASALTTGILTVAPPGAAPDIPAGCDTFASPPSGSSTTC